MLHEAPFSGKTPLLSYSTTKEEKALTNINEVSELAGQKHSFLEHIRIINHFVNETWGWSGAPKPLLKWKTSFQHYLIVKCLIIDYLKNIISIHMLLICPLQSEKCVCVCGVARPQRFICNIPIHHILQLAVFTVPVPASKSTTLLYPHTSIWCTSPSASLNPQQSPFCGSPKSLPTRPCSRTKSHSRLNWD